MSEEAVVESPSTPEVAENTTPENSTNSLLSSSETKNTVDTPMSKPFYDGFYDSEGKINKAALENLPEYLQSSKGLFEKYDTVESLLNGMANLGKLAGKKGLEPLPPDAPQEVVAERDQLMKKLNSVPEDIEGYGINKPEDWPENVPFSEERVGKYLSVLHKHNASPELVKELVELDLGEARNAFSEADVKQDEFVESEKAALKEIFGSDYDRNIELAKRAAETMKLDTTDPVFANHKVVMLAAEIGKLRGEHGLVSGSGSANQAMDDRQKALDIMSNKNNPHYQAYWDRKHPQHEEAVRLRSSLNASYLEKTRK